MSKHFSMPEIPKLNQDELENAYQEQDTLRVSGDSLKILTIAASTFISLIEGSEEFFYLDESEGMTIFSAGHLYPRAYHLSAIGLPFCDLIISYIENVFEDAEAKEGLREYLRIFRSGLRP